MDTLCKVKKLQAMNSHKFHFLHNLIFHSLTVIGILCLFPLFWFSSLPIKKTLFLSLSNSFSSIFTPKWLFIVVNVIVVFLLGESKFFGPSPTKLEIYDEYVERSRSLRRVSTTQENKADEIEFESNMTQIEREDVKEIIQVSNEEDKETEEEFQEVADEVEEEAEEQEVEEEEEGDEEFDSKEEEEGKERDRGGEEEENGLPTEELNRKVEEFIARVNRQRWLEEAKLLVCCSA